MAQEALHLPLSDPHDALRDPCYSTETLYFRARLGGSQGLELELFCPQCPHLAIPASILALYRAVRRPFWKHK